jgi:hypothetical protein
MKHKMQSGLLVLLAGMVLNSQVWAGDMYFGAKTGPMMIDVSGVSDPTNAGILVGYELGVVVGDLAVEGEFTTTIDEGKSGGNEVDIDTMALYLAFRTAGPVYLKLKGGVLRQELDAGAGSESDSGMSYGIGVGFGLGIGQLELEYTEVDDDVTFVSFGIQF